MCVYLGFGHALPLWLAIIGVIALVSTPIALVAYVREALSPHDEMPHTQ
jgi:hypothetical protein